MFARFLPPTCADYQPVWLDEDGAPTLKAKKGDHRQPSVSTRCALLCLCICICRLDFAWWLLAWDRYALAAAATQQMSFQLAMKHRNNIANIATEALVEGKSTRVAVVYDELVR